MNLLSKTLADEFEKRKTENHEYNKKKFAKDLGIAQGTLTGLITGKHGLSPKRAQSILENLRLDHAKTRELSLFIDANYSRSRNARRLAKMALDDTSESRDLTVIPEETFSEHFQWHHIAIMELSKTKPFKCDNEFISKRLGIPRKTVSQAIRKLKKLGYIEVKFGGLELKLENGEVSARTSAESIKTYHEILIEKARASVRGSSYRDHELSSLMVAIDPDDLPRARKMIRKFWQRFDKEFGNSKTPKELYALNTQLFPISQSINSEGQT